MKRLSFVADADTMAIIGTLKADLNARDEAEVFRKSLALLKAAADAGKASDGVVTLIGRGAPEGVSVALRA